LRPARWVGRNGVYGGLKIRSCLPPPCGFPLRACGYALAAETGHNIRTLVRPCGDTRRFTKPGQTRDRQNEPGSWVGEDVAPLPPQTCGTPSSKGKDRTLGPCYSASIGSLAQWEG